MTDLPFHGLRDLRVIDLSSTIAGAYTSKLFADAGADVVKVEPATGDPLRRWSATNADLGARDGALFRALHCNKRSVVGRVPDPEIRALIRDADLIIDTDVDSQLAELGITPAGLPDALSGLVVCSITPYGRTGPFADRPATEFTVQCECGSTARRGMPDMEPFHAAGRITEFVGATFAAAAAAASLRRAKERGYGEYIDFSLMEVMTIASSTYGDLMHSLMGRPPIEAPARVVELPSIEPTLDGWVGFNTNSRQQFNDFCLLIERPDLASDEEMASVFGRKRRYDEWMDAVRSFTSAHTTKEVVSRASLLRIPVAPVNDGRSVLEHEHLVARDVFTLNPDGDFVQPRPSYQVNGHSPTLRTAAPKLGEHTGQIEPHTPIRRKGRPSGERALPLAGLRVLDCTAWWAGPSSAGLLAALGADVIHIESIQKPDGMRMVGASVTTQGAWWEYAAVFLAANTNKRSLTLNFADPEGLRLMHEMIKTADMIVENFSPRVFDQFGFTWEAIHALNPRTILIRMPAFGLGGPWRDNVGFAQTMEQVTGLAWITSHADDQPRIHQGPCDPLAGMHAAFAFMVALAERDRTGEGVMCEVPMVEGALQAAVGQIVEYSAYGRLMFREGNRSPYAAPQGLYRARGGPEEWVGISVETDAQWTALKAAMGQPRWADAPELRTHWGRRAHHDDIDVHVRAWVADRTVPEAVELLVAAGVPAATVFDPRVSSTHIQHIARDYHEYVPHPVVGTHPYPRPPFRFASVDTWVRTPAPTMGQHNAELLAEVGVDAAKLSALEAAAIIGTKPAGY